MESLKKTDAVQYVAQGALVRLTILVEDAVGGTKLRVERHIFVTSSALATTAETRDRATSHVIISLLVN